MASRKPAPKRLEATSPWEWGVAAVGGVLILSAIVYMVWYGLVSSETFPHIELRPLETSSTAGGHVVKIAVGNEGNSTAASVEVEGRLEGPDGAEEVSEVTLDYVPANSEREAYLQFDRNPEDFKLSLRVKGMAKP